MSHALVIHVRFHDGRYHGDGDWPPSPARLFQALVAAAGLNGQIAAARDSLAWLERLPRAPTVCAPPARRGHRVMFYMPNNDLDAVQGDPRRVAKIRTAKKYFYPWLFDPATPFVYVWQDVAEREEEHAHTILSLADRIYQLGRGIDMAWAWGELLGPDAVDDLLARHAGPVYRPTGGRGALALPCPRPGSLASTEARFAAYRHRFDVVRSDGTVRRAFRQPPRPSFRLVAYESPPARLVYELRCSARDSTLASWPLAEVARLVRCLRDGAVQRLEDALPARRAEIARVLVGRKPDGENDGPTTERVRVVPLPSIGHQHADRAVRRVLIEVPPGCPLSADDVGWTFSGLEPIDPDTGERFPIILMPAASDGMLRHYGIDGDNLARTWRTVTPAALPQEAGRRRIDPERISEQAKDGAERAWELRRASAAVAQALRHAQVGVPFETIRVQREPFEGSGQRVEAFAHGTRFPKERLWHVEIAFAEPVAGPLLIGDGRFLGLGLMAPVFSVMGFHGFVVESGLAGHPDPTEIARAFRRAIMARVQHVVGGNEPLPPFLTGHERDGSPARSERHPHLTFVFEPRSSRLFVFAPHILDRRQPTREEMRNLMTLDQALTGFCELRAGLSGCLRLRRVSLDCDSDPLIAPSRKWESVTPYVVTRHARLKNAMAALDLDLRAECRRRGLPEPTSVTTEQPRGIAGTGLTAACRLEFRAPVMGPLILGRNRHVGGGLFLGVKD